MNHAKMRRILDKYWRVPGRSLTRQWDGVEDLQAYFDELGVTNVTAVDLIAKEGDYDTFIATKSDRQKDDLADIIMEESGVVTLGKALNDGSFVPGSHYTPAQMKAIIRKAL